MKRAPHAVLDLPSRHQKARKIEALLQLDSRLALDILEIGYGSGGISDYLANHARTRHRVQAVDVVDSRLSHEGYHFTQVENTKLPFADSSFDLVISNHVIEHVGDRLAQRAHLAEIARVMRADGRTYLAVPNRWQLVEPHFRLPFLSWLPRSLRSPYVRLAGRGSHYDCEPLQLKELETEVCRAGFKFQNLCIPALRVYITEDGAKGLDARLANKLPDRFLASLLPIFPTLIYLLALR